MVGREMVTSRNESQGYFEIVAETISGDVSENVWGNEGRRRAGQCAQPSCDAESHCLALLFTFNPNASPDDRRQETLKATESAPQKPPITTIG